MLDKNFRPNEAESAIYAAWEASGAFKAGRPERADADPYTIVIPPPNVTGSLHMGHAFNTTIQDILVRFERMRGRDVLWQPGMDHAGIATQMVVERQLAENKEPSRREMGRKAFIYKVWEWKAQSGGTILNQLKRLGASCDWSRERFTMDPGGMSEAVTKVFVELYNTIGPEGRSLIYKDKRLVNWDPVFQTAISDLEVEQREVDGHMWQFAYPLVDGPVDGRAEIIIATTRPETMLGDGAVAVHPSDERYKNLIGKMVRLPIAERLIPIIADEYPDPEFGSGAVKITGAHDFNDFEVARRNNIPLIPLMDGQARMIVTPENCVPAHYEGIDRYEARELVLKEIKELGFYRGVEDKVIAQPFGDRSGVVIEPMLTDQWYVDAATLAKPAIEAVEQGDTVFVPKNWEKTYFEWMRNIQPWCISRQLWWGHQIPAWYGPKPTYEDGDTHAVAVKFDFDPIKVEQAGNLETFVAKTELDALQMASELYPGEVGIAANARDFLSQYDKDGRIRIWRDEDVLDTWFSSALWPFSTLGWPDETPELKKYYKTDVLVTAFDIIFFWVARMMMAGLQFMKDDAGRPQVPFHTVYIHALVRDEHGAKMSKSKGNAIDPLELVDEFGADALRFTLAAMAAQGRDIKLSKARVAGYRNFTTKLWNAARFAQMNGCEVPPGFDAQSVKGIANRWIVAELGKTVGEVTAGIEAYRFNEAASALYRFVWNVYCDWYLEIVKPEFADQSSETAAQTRATTAWVLEQTLKLLHPFMPFITEALWSETATTARDTALVTAPWPGQTPADADASADMDWLIGLITEVRATRAELNVPPGARLPLVAVGEVSAQIRQRIGAHTTTCMRLARLENIDFADQPPENAVQIVHQATTFALPLTGAIDIGAETERLAREIAKSAKEIAGIDAKLANANFTSRAPAHVVETQRQRRNEAAEQTARLESAHARLLKAL